MIPEITIGATSIFGTLILATAASRWAVTPPREPGRHRSGQAPSLPGTDVATCPCAPWPQMTTHTLLPKQRLACCSCGRIKEASL